jgi:cytochrome c553
MQNVGRVPCGMQHSQNSWAFARADDCCESDPSWRFSTRGGRQRAGRPNRSSVASCHGLDGGEKGIPSIIGLGEDRLTRAMLAYRSGERSSHIMRAIALSLSDEEIATVARFLDAQGKKAEPR